MACKNRLLHIPRRCLPCPFPNCKLSISMRLLLNHACLEHQQVPRLPISTLYPVTVKLNPSNWVHGEMRALALLEYGGRDDKLDFSAVATKLCLPNTLTNTLKNKRITASEQVLPILLMGCRTSVLALCDPSQPIEPKRDKCLDMLVVWLVANCITRDLYACLKLCLKPTKILAEREFLLRTVETPNTVENVLHNSNRFLLIFQGEVAEICYKKVLPLFLRVAIRDYADPLLGGANIILLKKGTNPYRQAERNAVLKAEGDADNDNEEKSLSGKLKKDPKYALKVGVKKIQGPVKKWKY